MTKADRIRLLDDGSLTPQQIADFVGCLREYVYVVRQRKDGRSKADRQYLKKRESDPDFRHRNSTASLEWQRKNREYWNACQRERYHRRKAAQ